MDHKIEELARVYLIANDGGWEVDTTTVDGHGLDGYDNGALNEACECDDDPAECEAARVTADGFPLPTGDELAVMLVDAVLTHTETTDPQDFRARLAAVLSKHSLRAVKAAEAPEKAEVRRRLALLFGKCAVELAAKPNPESRVDYSDPGVVLLSQLSTWELIAEHNVGHGEGLALLFALAYEEGWS